MNTSARTPQAKLVGVVVLIGIGAALIGWALTLPGSPSLLFGLGGGLVGGGVAALARLVYWTRPGRSAEFAERLESQSIDRHDELKQRLRYQSGWAAYLITLAALALLVVGFAVTAVVSDVDTRLVITTLGAVLLVSYLSGLVAFQILSRRYT